MMPTLPEAVREARERLTALLATLDSAAAAWVEQVRAARPATPTVVVVGETARGKSSLVDALLAAPGRSPAATACPVVLRHGSEWTARACYAGTAADVADVAVPLDDLARWVSAEQDPPDGAAPPHHVVLTAPVPLLERLTLVDTPGVGGLAAAPGELAAATAATALLLVLDAGAPISRGELDFLTRLGDRVETVLVALTKTDAHCGWREVLEADRAALARHAPRFAGVPFHPVSARLAERAADAPPAVAALLREQSGVAALQAALQHQVTGRAAMLGEANVLRALATALDGAAADLDARQRAVRGDDAAALRTRRDELTAARRTSSGGTSWRGWQLRLRGEVQRARVAATHDVAARLLDARTRLRAGLDAADRAGLHRLPRDVDAALRAVGDAVAAGLTERVTVVADAAVAHLFPPAELAAVRAGLACRPPPVALRPPGARPAGADDKLLVAMGFSGGLGLGRLAVLPLVGTVAVALPVSIVLGVGAGWWLARTRRHAADRAHLAQWLADVLAEARAALDQAVAAQLIDVEQQLSLLLDDALERRLAAVDSELREVDRALRMDAAERTRTLEALRAQAAEVRAGRQEVAGLLAHVRRLRDRPAAEGNRPAAGGNRQALP